MLTLSLKVGEAVQVGNDLAIKVMEKSGRCVRLGFATKLGPIRIIKTGIIPAALVPGVTDQLHLVHDPIILEDRPSRALA